MMSMHEFYFFVAYKVLMLWGIGSCEPIVSLSKATLSAAANQQSLASLTDPLKYG